MKNKTQKQEIDYITLIFILYVIIGTVLLTYFGLSYGDRLTHLEDSVDSPNVNFIENYCYEECLYKASIGLIGGDFNPKVDCWRQIVLNNCVNKTRNEVKELLDAEWVCTANRTVQKTVDVEEWCIEKHWPNYYDCEHTWYYNNEIWYDGNEYGWICHITGSQNLLHIPTFMYNNYQSCLAQDVDGDGYAVVEETECVEYTLVRK